MKARIFILFSYLFMACQGFLMAQQSKATNAELSGTLSFDVSQPFGYVRFVEITIGDGGTGPFKAVMTGDTSLVTHTIYRPADLGKFGKKEKLPIVVYGNGGCRNGSVEVRNLLSEIASHGFLVMAVGPVKNAIFEDGAPERNMSDPKSLTTAIDWAIAQNSLMESIFYGRVDVNKVAVMGQSCGGLMAMGVSGDPRVTTIIMWNSGLFTSPPVLPNNNKTQATGAVPKMNLPMVPKSDLKKLHGSIAYFTGGEYDIATKNAADDFSLIEQIPVLHADYDFSEKVKETGNKVLGHYPVTYREPNGGEFAKAGVAWLKWQLKGDQEAAKIFKGIPCPLQKNQKWTVSKKNID